MPSHELTDLDVLLPEPRPVQLGGKVYKLPGDLLVPTMIELQQLQSRVDSDDEAEVAAAVEGLYAKVLELFRVHQPEIESVPVSPPQLFALVNMVYGDKNPDDEVDPTPAAPAAGATTRTTQSRKKKSASRSSAS